MLGFGAAAAAYGLEHFAHLGVLAEKVVDVLDGGPGAARDAFAAAAVYESVRYPLPFRSRDVGNKKVIIVLL